MNRFGIQYLASAIVLITWGCDRGPSSPSTEACTPVTAAVTITVVTGPTVVFDWEPACGVALLLVEEGATDRWSIMTDESGWDDPDRANRITPPVTYGTEPVGGLESTEAHPLEVGTTYEVVLWRIMPEGSSSRCRQRLGDACLVAVQSFAR